MLTANGDRITSGRYVIASNIGAGPAVNIMEGVKVREANARRLAAAWNACDGISTDDLDFGPPMRLAQEAQRNLAASLQAEMLAAQQQRDRLLADLREIATNESSGGDVLRDLARCAIEVHEDDVLARAVGVR